MAGHDAPAVYLEALVLLAVLPAIQYNLPVFVADEQVYPAYNSKTYKIKPILLFKFILVLIPNQVTAKVG